MGGAAEVAHLEVEDREAGAHRLPFVDGTPVTRGFGATATASARATALKVPSIAWWALPGTSRRTCRVSPAVRLINLSPGSPPISLYGSYSGSAAAPLAAALSSRPYGYDGKGNTYAFVLTPVLSHLSLRSAQNPGQDLPLANSNLNTLTFQSGMAYTIYVYGQSGNTRFPLSAVVVANYTSL